MVVKVGCPASSVLCLRRTHVLASYLSSFVDSVDMVFNRVCKFFIISVCACERRRFIAGCDCMCVCAIYLRSH